MQVRRRQGHSGGAASESTAEYRRVPQGKEYRRVPQSTVEAPLPSLKVCDIKPHPYVATRGWVFAHREMSTHPLQRGPLCCNADHSDHSVASRTTPLQRGPPRCNADRPRRNTDHPVATRKNKLQRSPARGILSLSSCPLLQGMGQAAGVAAADALDMSARRRRRRRRRSPREGLSRRASYRTHGVSSGAPPGTETLGNRRGPSRLLVIFSASNCCWGGCGVVGS